MIEISSNFPKFSYWNEFKDEKFENNCKGRNFEEIFYKSMLGSETEYKICADFLLHDVEIMLQIESQLLQQNILEESVIMVEVFDRYSMFFKEWSDDFPNMWTKLIYTWNEFTLAKNSKVKSLEIFDIKSDQYKNENKTVIKNMKIGDQFLSSEICKFQYFNLKVAIEGLYFQFLKRFLPATNEYENLSMRTTRSFRDWVAYIPLVGDIVNHNDALSQREILKK